MKAATVRLALVLLISALTNCRGVLAGLLMQFFKDAQFKGKFTYGSIGAYSKCHNLPDDFAKQVSSMRWTSTNTKEYDEFDWINFFAERDCANTSGMVGFANLTSTSYPI